MQHQPWSVQNIIAASNYYSSLGFFVIGQSVCLVCWAVVSANDAVHCQYLAPVNMAVESMDRWGETKDVSNSGRIVDLECSG